MEKVIIEKETQRLSYNPEDQTIHEYKFNSDVDNWVWNSSFPLTQYWVDKLRMYTELAGMIAHRVVKTRQHRN